MMWPTEHATLSLAAHARVVQAAEPALRALLVRDKIVETDVWPELVGVHVPLANFIAARHKLRGGPLVVGIVGTQGSGKSTLTRWLACLLQTGFGLHAVPYALEGWCVGATPEPDAALQHPVNALERERDADGSLRRFVNEQLRGPYAHWFAELDALIMLRAPSFERVEVWRFEQEQKLAAVLPGAPALRSKGGRTARHLPVASVRRSCVFAWAG